MNKGIYYNFTDFKSAYEKLAYGRIGLFIHHSRFHEGHALCAMKAREKCDFVIGILHQNFGYEQLKVFGKQHDDDKPFEESDLIPLKTYSDLGLVLKDDYYPAFEYVDVFKKKFDLLFPPSFLEEKKIVDNLYVSLFLSCLFRYNFHEINKIHADYQVQTGRDRWRTIGYTKWVWDEYKCFIDVVDPQRDNTGNVVSGMKNKLPKHLQDRLNKPLLLPTFKCKEDVEEHIKDIEGLHVDYFFREYGWIQVKFYFEPHQWWADGLKLERDE